MDFKADKKTQKTQQPTNQSTKTPETQNNQHPWQNTTTPPTFK